MEKHILRWSYFLGVFCFAVALAWRGANTLGFWIPGLIAAGETVWYMSFYKAGLMFSLVAISTGSYISAMKQ